MVSLIDTNVIMNFITKRDDLYKEECFKVIQFCAENAFKGYIAFHSLSTIWYVIRRVCSDEKARECLNRICDIMKVTGATQEQIKEAIENINFKDFESK